MASTQPDVRMTGDLQLLDHRDAWVSLVIGISAVALATDVLYQGLALAVIPPFALLAVLRAAVIVLLRRDRRRSGAITAIVASVLSLLLFAPGIVDVLTHPQSSVDFLHGSIHLGAGVIGLFAAISVLRRADDGRARSVAAVALGLLGVAAVVATVAGLGDASPARAAGDADLLVERAEFSDATVATGGTVYVDNRDLFRHTFAIEEAGIDVELPAKEARRIDVDLAPGTYVVTCSIPGHEFMEGTLTVEG